MIRCEDISEKLSGYLDDELTQGDFQRVDVHLRSCQTCRDDVAEMKRLRNAVQQSQDNVSFPDENWEKVMSDLPTKASR